ncbi:hypothetical protein RBH26_12085 [Natronolimnohabitans sp. A-GB9]|uniref:hypothetical protein n=1 Tax=Natronolimnohabitans sp. A-GB9 TaxID=3069757 RepID=UPI0027AF05F8|nr:hypothetical protein [Natronolimnohabitans sp. A-GB9]MDQ2051218.1 hypothetical protein [Natronolimnohabitans sp. A-GB9]
MSDDGPNRDRVQDRAERRKAERAETTESILDDVERHLGDVEYPITGEAGSPNEGSLDESGSDTL